MQLNATAASIAVVLFLKKAAIIIAVYGQKHYTDSRAMLYSGIYNCDFEAIN